jgi:hypothetical protein
VTAASVCTSVSAVCTEVADVSAAVGAFARQAEEMGSSEVRKSSN